MDLQTASGRAGDGPLNKTQQTLVTESLGLVRSLSAQIARSWPATSFDELVSTGHEALARAALRFDPSRSVPFVNYAYQYVRGEMMACA